MFFFKGRVEKELQSVLLYSREIWCYEQLEVMRTTFSFEDYLTKFFQDLRNAFVKFRTTNHRLPNETGRWQHVDVYNFLAYYLMMNVRWMIDKMYNGWLSKYMDIKKTQQEENSVLLTIIQNQRQCLNTSISLIFYYNFQNVPFKMAVSTIEIFERKAWFQ